jgi:hypothetical protein
MAATAPPSATARAPPRVAPADVQGDPLARLLITHPDAAAAVFAHLDYADATPLREACRGFCGAVGEHPWALPAPPLMGWGFFAEVEAFDGNGVKTPAGLARWRAAFPAARTLVLARARGTPGDSELFADAHLATVSQWGLTGVYMHRQDAVTRAGLAALVAGPSLTALVLSRMVHLSGADVAAGLAGALPRLRTLALHCNMYVTDADLAGWGRLHRVDLRPTCDGFTGAGFGALADVRELTIGLSHEAVGWHAGAFSGLTRLTSLSLVHPILLGTTQLRGGGGGLFAGVPRSLRRVLLSGARLTWPAGQPHDGGAALLAPLAAVSDVSLRSVHGVTDAGLCQLTGAARLELAGVDHARGDSLAPLAGSLRELAVDCSMSPEGGKFTGRGLGALRALETLTLAVCPYFRARRVAALAGGCPALRAVSVSWSLCDEDEPPFDAARAQAALRAGPGGGAWRFVPSWGFEDEEGEAPGDGNGKGTDSDDTWTATRAPAPAAGHCGCRVSYGGRHVQTALVE